MDNKDLAELLKNVKEILDEKILKFGIVTYSVDWQKLIFEYDENYNCSTKAEFNKNKYTIEQILDMAIERLNNE